MRKSFMCGVIKTVSILFDQPTYMDKVTGPWKEDIADLDLKTHKLKSKC